MTGWAAWAWLLGLVGLGAALLLFLYVRRQDAGPAEAVEIARHIHEGAMAFLRRKYLVLAGFVLVVALLLAWATSPRTAIAYLTGAISSVLAGFFGMNAATRANVRTAAAAALGSDEGAARALRLAFFGGCVMGLSVASLGLLGVGGWYLAQGAGAITDADFLGFARVVSGFAMGASSIALFARVAGGIYTKAADVGADLVGKLEAGIPEDDARNPATIADIFRHTGEPHPRSTAEYAEHAEVAPLNARSDRMGASARWRPQPSRGPRSPFRFHPAGAACLRSAGHTRTPDQE
ncbi:MAG TPA: sodium/proton-translocating pyrophosphatase, partial [Longimicrobiales bacterium]